MNTFPVIWVDSGAFWLQVDECDSNTTKESNCKRMTAAMKKDEGDAVPRGSRRGMRWGDQHKRYDRAQSTDCVQGNVHKLFLGGAGLGRLCAVLRGSRSR